MNPEDPFKNNPNQQPTQQPVPTNPTHQDTSLLQQTPTTSFQGQSYSSTMGTPNKSKKMLLMSGGVLAVLAIIGGIGFAARDSSKKTEPGQPNASNTSATDLGPATQPEKPVEAKQTETAINKIVASDLGKTITATKLIRNYNDEDLASNEEGILVEVRAESDGSYTSVIGKSAFRLIGDDGKEIRTAYLITEADLTKAGFTPISSTSLKKGQPVTGFLAFAVPRDNKKLTFRYHRSETKILGGQTLPAKDFDIVIAQ